MPLRIVPQPARARACGAEKIHRNTLKNALRRGVTNPSGWLARADDGAAQTFGNRAPHRIGAGQIQSRFRADQAPVMSFTAAPASS
jgi:hypothetical protein